MAKRKATIWAASAALTLAVVAGAGCSDIFGGSYELKEFVVNTSGVSLAYEVGEDVSFDGLSMIAMFSDATTKNVKLSEVKIYLGEEDVTANLSKITENAGKKKVKIVYSTDHGEDFYEFEITVSEEVVEKITLASFNTPTFISDYKQILAMQPTIKRLQTLNRYSLRTTEWNIIPSATITRSSCCLLRKCLTRKQFRLKLWNGLR